MSRDGGLAFVFVQQARSTDETSFIVPFMRVVRRVVAEILVEHPGIASGFTGWPAVIEADHDLLLTDLPRVSLIALVAILLIFLAGFGSVYRTLLVLVPLVCGEVWTLGLTVLTLGHLSYLSSVFVGILFGLGIDFGIYFVGRFDEERHRGADPRAAVQRTLATAGRGVVTGGLTAVVAFLAIGFSELPAFSELGLVAGMGVALVLAATLLLLPALLVELPPPLGRARAEAGSPTLRATARVVLRRPRLTLGVAALVALVSAAGLPRLGFDYDLNNLLPADSEALRTLRQMARRSPYSDQFIAVIAEDLDQVRALHEALDGLETVARVESLAAVIPTEPETKRAILESFGELLPRRVDGPRPASDTATLARSLGSFVDRLADAEEDAFVAGHGDAVEAAGKLLRQLEAIRDLLRGGEAATRQRAFEDGLFAERDRIVGTLAQMTQAEPVALDNLDPRLRERFVGSSGRLLAMAFPAAPIWDREFLDRFVEQVRGEAAAVLGARDIDSRVTGFPVTYQVTAPAIRRGFALATWGALIIVGCMLLLDFRSLSAALVAATPLAATALVLLGGMAWLGIRLTMRHAGRELSTAFESRVFASLLACVTLLLPAARGWAAPRDLLVLRPGGPRPSEEARRQVSRLVLEIAARAGWEPGSARAFYHNSSDEALQHIEDDRPGFLLSTPAFYLAHREELRLTPVNQILLGGKDTHCYFVVARKGEASGLQDLADGRLVGSALVEPRFVERVVLGGRLDFSRDVQAEYRRALSALRALAHGEVKAAVLDEIEHDGLAALPLAGDLETVFRSEPIPNTGIFALGETARVADIDALAKATEAFCTAGEGASICDAYQISGFQAAAPGTFDALIRAYDGPPSAR